ncbi:hypothetical protein [Bradyrhizobium yuanmingense]|nr:hypothetical protein [Bradyrhizobium yuanmingense]
MTSPMYTAFAAIMWASLAGMLEIDLFAVEAGFGRKVPANG